MKVVVFNDTYKELSGAETYFFHLGDLLARQGHTVSLAGFGDKHERTTDSYMYQETGVSLLRYLWRVTFNIRVYLSFRRWLRQRQPDVIHLCNINKYTLAVLAACRGHRVVHSVLDYGLVCPGKFAVRLDTMEDCPRTSDSRCFDHHCLPWYYLVPMCLFSKMRKWFLGNVVNHYITESPLLKEYLETFRYMPVQQLNLGIPIDDWRLKEKKETTNILLYVGFLEENKGVLTLPEILERVHSIHPQIKMKIVGDGSKKSALVKKFRELGVEKSVEMVGRVRLPELEPLYQEADMLIMPSLLIDNAPLVIMQAMLCGTPVVGSRRGGIPWQVGEGGYIATANDPSSFAEGIATYYTDKDKWRQASTNARGRALELFNSKVNIQKIISLYSQL